MVPREFICDACGLPPHAVEDAALAGQERSAGQELPAKWVRRTFGRRKFILCDCCGSTHHFKGGLSTYLQETLGLGPYAVCDFAADAAPGSGLHRLRIKQPDPTDDPPEGAGS